MNIYIYIYIFIIVPSLFSQDKNLYRCIIVMRELTIISYVVTHCFLLGHLLVNMILKQNKMANLDPLRNPLLPILGGGGVLVPLALLKNLGHNAPPYLMAHFEQKKNRKFIILTIFAQTNPLMAIWRTWFGPI